MSNVQNLIFREAGLAFEPLSKMDSAYSVNKLFNELGYTLTGSDEFPDFPGLAACVETVIEKLVLFDKAGEDKKNEALAELLAEISKLTAEIMSLKESIEDAVTAAPDFISDAPLNELPKRLLDYIIVEYCRQHHKSIHSFMNMFGVFETEILPEDLTIFQPATSLRKVKWERLPKLISDPAGLFNDVYKWDSAFDSDKFFENVNTLLSAFLLPGGLYAQSPSVKHALGNTTDNLKEIRFPIFQNTLYPGLYSQFGVNITTAEAIGSKLAGFGILPYLYGSGSFSFDLNNMFKISLDANASIDSGLGIIVRPNDIELLTSLFETPTDSVNLKIELNLEQKEDTGEIILFGNENASRLSIEGPSLKVFVKKDAKSDAGFEIKLNALRLIISGGDGDGFLSKILDGVEINAETEFTLGFSAQNGFYFVGSGGLELLLNTHITIGPLEIQAIMIALNTDASNLEIESGATFSVNIGPLVAVVENIGVITTVSFPENGGNVGPLDLALGFKPPNGLGLSINAGAVTGGGYLFFDFEKEEYAGALELSIAGFISAKAIGLITTKMPDGSKGFSMLIIITAEFNPPFQLGYGFTLIGVGGLLGLNRTVLLDPLRDGVRTGAVNSIMFPQNVIANAPRIISDLKTIFPPYEGKFLIGPMAKIGWGTPTLISLSLGLIIEIPGNIAILGVLKIALPVENAPLVQIQVAFLGTIDFNKKMLTFDASLYESYILTMTLEGDMAVRLKWGDNPDFILSVGGFHPSYTPPPLALPTLRRLAINILNTSIAKIRVECYQAITSNTVQFGAKAEIFFDLSACSIKGHIAFDALFQFSPFYFIIDLSASFTLKAIGIDVMSVRVKMSLEGPTPWRAKGTGSVSLLFFDISANFDKTWGEKKNTDLPDIIILPRFIEELNKKEQWSTVLFSDKNLLVSLRNFKESSTPLLILHPAGSLVIQQKLLPLMVKIDKIGNQKTSDIQKITISNASSAGVALHISNVDENFARAQYQNLSDADKLSKPSFEKMPGGVEISMGTGSINNGKFVRKKVEYEVTIVDKEAAPVFFFAQIGILFTNFLKGNSASKSPLSKNRSEKLNPFSEKVKVKEEGYTVAFQSTNKAFNATAQFSCEMLAHTYMQEAISKNPALKKEIHIVPNYELQAS